MVIEVPSKFQKKITLKLSYGNLLLSVLGCALTNAIIIIIIIINIMNNNSINNNNNSNNNNNDNINNTNNARWRNDVSKT